MEEMNNNNNILEIKNLSKQFKDFELKNISFELKKGYIMGFIGPNGSGKTTIIKLILNLLNKNSGEIKVFGKDNVTDEIFIKDNIGFVFEENHYYEHLTIKKMKNIVAPFYSKWSDEDFNRYLTRFNLDENKKIGNLSKGNKIKFALAIALSHNADFLILDEPTSGLDPLFRNEFCDILREFIQDENRAVLFSTHITSDLENVADFVTYINEGELLFSEEKDVLLQKYCIIKGDKSLLEKVKDKFISYKENSYGFEALTNRKDEILEKFGSELVYENATIEQIMIFNREVE